MATSYVDVHQLERLRPLGKLEEFSSARHHLGVFLNVGISASYIYKGESPVELREVVFSALSVVIQRHPILSAIPVDEDSAAPYFARLPKINLDDVVTFVTRQTMYEGDGHDAELDSLLETQHRIDFKANYGRVPFWRLLILTQPGPDIEFVASFIYHHALGDGASGVALQKHFFSALAADPKHLESKIIACPSNDLLPNLELLHPLPIPPTDLAHQPSATWTGGPINFPMKSHIQTLVLSQDLTDSFIRTCRAHQTTMTATLPLIVARILEKLLPPGPHVLKCTIPINIRRFLPPGRIRDADMGVWIDAISITHQSQDGPIWDQAREAKAVISDYLASDGQRINVARMKQRGDMREVFRSMMGRDRDSSFELSNLGVVRAEMGEGDEKGWSMGRCGFSRSAFAAGSAFSIGAITGCDGCLCLGFSWQKGVVERELMENVVKGVKVEVERLVSE